MADVVIRALAPTDAASAVAVIHAAFAAQGMVTDPPSGALRETVATIASQIGGAPSEVGGGFGAVLEGVLVGVVLWAERDGGLYFGRLAVRPGARGTGVGQALVAAVEREAARRGLPRVFLAARLSLAGNRAFFAACGYREVGVETHAGYGAPTSVVMEKQPLRKDSSGG